MSLIETDEHVNKPIVEPTSTQSLLNRSMIGETIQKDDVTFHLNAMNSTHVNIVHTHLYIRTIHDRVIQLVFYTIFTIHWR